MSEVMRPREYRVGPRDWRFHAVIIVGAGALCLKLQDAPWSGEVKVLLTSLAVLLTALGVYSLTGRFTTVDDQGITTGSWCRVQPAPLGRYPRHPHCCRARDPLRTQDPHVRLSIRR